MSDFEQEVRAFFESNREMFGNDWAVYSKEEWAKRGEIYCNSSPFAITFEGPFYEMWNYGDYDGGKYAEELRSIAKKHGYYFESAHGWMISPYKI